MNGRQPRGSVAGSKAAIRSVASGSRRSSRTESIWMRSRTFTPSIRLGATAGRMPLSGFASGEPSDHGSPAAGSATTKVPPRRIHSVSACAVSSLSRVGAIAPLAQMMARNGAKPSVRSGSASASLTSAMRVAWCIDGRTSAWFSGSSMSRPSLREPITSSASTSGVRMIGVFSATVGPSFAVPRSRTRSPPRSS